jgi:glycosyltransferase involved in cell wall biosynthesis
VIFISLTETSYSRSGLLAGNTFINSDFISLARDRSKYSQIKEILLQKTNIEAVIVMSPSHVLVLFLRHLYKGFIILDAGWPLSDSVENKEFSLNARVRKKIKTYLIDFFAFQLSDLVYLESNQQVAYSKKKFLISKKKLKVRLTGSLEKSQSLMQQEFRETIHSKCNNCNPVVFRGKYNKEAGLELLSKVSEALDPSVHLIVLCPTLPETIKFPQRQNITVITDFLPHNRLENMMSQAKLMVGQLGNSGRLNRTIPHKFFEAARLGIPYLTPATESIQEIASEESIYFINNKDARSLARQIETIVSDREALAKKSKNFRSLYETNLCNAVLMEKFMKEVTK